MKKLFLTTLASLAMFSCTQESMTESDKARGAIKLIVQPGTLSKAIDNAGSSSTDIQSMMIRTYANNDQLLDTYQLNPADITAAMSNGFVMQNVAVGSAKVTVVATLASGVELKEVLSTDNINDWQKTFVELPFQGGATINKENAAVGQDGNPVWTVMVNVNPQFARFEVYGEMDAAKAGLQYFRNIQITDLFMNNIKLTKDAAPILNVNNGQIGWGAGNWADPSIYTSVGGMFSQMWNSFDPTLPASGSGANGVDAYQLWEQSTTSTSKEDVAEEMPHVVLGVTYESAPFGSADWVTRSGFITIRNFKEEGLYLNKIQGGRIYRVDVSDMINYFVDPQTTGNFGTTPVEPTPEATRYSLEAAVTVTPWQIVTINPEL